MAFCVTPPSIPPPSLRRQLPKHNRGDTQHAPFLTSYVYVSSSDSDTDDFTSTKTAGEAPLARRRTSLQERRQGSLHFPSAEEGNRVAGWAEVQGAAAQPRRTGSWLGLDGLFIDEAVAAEGLSGGSVSSAQVDVDVSVERGRSQDAHTAGHLRRRVRELEQEVAALRAAATAAATGSVEVARAETHDT